jgi:hypothetical protein
MDNNTKIKNYELSFGELGIQFKFKKELTQSDIKNIMYYFEQYMNQLNSDFNLCKVLYNNAKKDKITINDIQN